jgi:hypothetical protein
VTHSFKLAALGFCSVALAGTAFADDVFTAKFHFDRTLSTEANYAEYQRTAGRACAVNLREVGGLAEERRIEADCKQRLMADAVRATGKPDLTALHNERTGARAPMRLAAKP